jgi:hypothetical protein
MELIEAFTDGVWEGTARFDIIDEGLTFGPWPVRWDPLSLLFTFDLDGSSDEFNALYNLHWRRLGMIKLYDVKLQCGLLVVHATGVEVRRSNSLTEWPDGLCESEDALKLVLGPTGEQCIEFRIWGDSVPSEDGAWWDNWPKKFAFPATLKEPAGRFETWSCRTPPNPAAVFLGCSGTSPRITSVHNRLQMVLELASGVPLPLRLLWIGDTVTVFKKVSCFPSNDLSMLEPGWAAQPLRELLHAGASLSDGEFEKLRYAAALTVEGKGNHIPGELRFLLLMMCVELLDDVSKLTDDATAAMLGVDRKVAGMLNGLRDALMHGSNGGGHANATRYFMSGKGRRCIDALPLEWLHVLNAERSQPDMIAIYLRLCERLDAFWCARLGMGADMQAFRAQHGPMIRLMPLPSTDLVTRCVPTANSAGGVSDPYVARLEAQLSQCSKQVKDLKDKNKSLRDRVRVLEAQLNGAEVSFGNSPSHR